MVESISCKIVVINSLKLQMDNYHFNLSLRKRLCRAFYPQTPARPDGSPVGKRSVRGITSVQP